VKLALPAWSALMVQLPADTKVNAPPEVIVQTPVVAEVNATAKFEVEVADNVGVVPKFCVPGLAKDIVWLAFGVTEFEAADAWPVPAPLVAVTVNVYAVPFVRPVTMMGDALPDPVKLPGLDVTV